MAVRRFWRNHVPTESLDAITRLWMLRILVPLRGHRGLINPGAFDNDALAEVLGLGPLDPDDEDSFDPRVARAQLKRQYSQAEESTSMVLPKYLGSNIKRLSKLAGLDEMDCLLLAFAVTLHGTPLLDDAADYLGNLSTVQLYRVLGVILGVPESKVRTALSLQGTLASTGLLLVDRDGASSLVGKLELLSSNVPDLMMSSAVEPIDLLRGKVDQAEPAELDLSHYPHIAKSLEILQLYLKHAQSTAKEGANICIYGAPGTGKTQLSRVLAKVLAYELFEVAQADSDGNPIDGKSRLLAYRAAQSFLAQHRALVVFDESEDVFDDGDTLIGRKSTAQLRKAWVNRTLETNRIPTLWLSNTIDRLDPAFLRRFDMVLELPIPPKRQREVILRAACPDFLSGAQFQRLSESEHLAPAVVDRASAVVRAIQGQLKINKPSEAFESLVNNTLQAQGHPQIKKYAAGLPVAYDPAFIHADADLNHLVEGIARSGSARLCLYGPPGTGKTAYGHWLAAQLDKPLLLKRASDLLSMWVGENEKNIAKAFHQAEREDAILLIDEVDSFLQSRGGAQRSWEITQVNEMLTQLESYEGIFIASTNLMGGLDPAALRRIDLKIKFDYLHPHQAIGLLGNYSTQLGLNQPTQDDQQQVSSLGTLTPGDFAAVARRHAFSPFESCAMMVRSLADECVIKTGGRGVMGFV